MNNLIDDILTDWAYRVHDGMPNPKNQYHLVQLQESMKSLKVESEVIDMVMNHLYEAKGHKYIKRTGSKGNYEYTYPDDGSGKTPKTVEDVTNEQQKIEDDRDKGIAVAGGPVASQGESNVLDFLGQAYH